VGPDWAGAGGELSRAWKMSVRSSKRSVVLEDDKIKLKDDAIGVADKKKPKKEADIWGGASFGHLQLVCYVMSCTCMCYYFLHFCCSFLHKHEQMNLHLLFPSSSSSSSSTDANGGGGGGKIEGREEEPPFPLSHRINFHAIAEVFILILRFANELYYSKWGPSDVAHHAIYFFGVYLGFYINSFSPYMYLLCQMQVLHFPMLLWYTGCRRNSFVDTFFEEKQAKRAKRIEAMERRRIQAATTETTAATTGKESNEEKDKREDAMRLLEAIDEAAKQEKKDGEEEEEELKGAKSICRAVFPVWWVLSISYRATIMLSSAYQGFSFLLSQSEQQQQQQQQQQQAPQGVISIVSSSSLLPAASILIFGLVLFKLDYDWTRYFFGKGEGCLNWPLSHSLFVLLYLSGVGGGLVTAFVL